MNVAIIVNQRHYRQTCYSTHLNESFSFMSQPPLKAMQCFCLSAHHLSLKRAAHELAVTPGAVSQQVKLLEHWLGFALFHRRARSITLTEAGNSYFRRIAPQMDELVNISHSVKQVDRIQVVRLSLPPSFAMQCMRRYLPALRRDHPDIDLRLHASAIPQAVQESGEDIALRYLACADPALDCTRLFHFEVFPVCSPAYLDAHPSLASGRLDGITLIHDILHQDWHRLIQAQGLSARGTESLHCDQAMLALQAAESGLGIALCDPLLAREALQDQRLVIPFEARLEARRHLFLVHRRHPPISPAASQAKDWLMTALMQGGNSTPLDTSKRH